MTLIHELQEYVKQYQAIQKDANDLLSSISEEQFLTPRSDGGWSIAQHIEHLILVGEKTLTRTEEKIIEGQVNKSEKESFKYGPLNRWFTKILEPPVKRKFKTSKTYAPQPEKELSVMQDEFDKLQERFITNINSANGLNLKKIKVQSPALSFLRFSLGTVFASQAAHERRHLWLSREMLK